MGDIHDNEQIAIICKQVITSFTSYRETSKKPIIQYINDFKEFYCEFKRSIDRYDKKDNLTIMAEINTFLIETEKRISYLNNRFSPYMVVYKNYFSPRINGIIGDLLKEFQKYIDDNPLQPWKEKRDELQTLL
jgi:hypothetical protein